MSDGPSAKAADESAPVLSRREFLVGTGVGGAVALGGTELFLSDQEGSASEPAFLVQQGYLRWELDPIAKGDLNVREFYNVEGTSADPTANLIDEDAASRIFVYDGPVDASLVFLHGSREVDHGGTAEFSFSGLSRDAGEWAVRDDPRSVSDDFAPWDGGNARVKWQWGENTTDGGAYWGVLDRDDFTITITPRTLSGVDAWKVLSGDLGDLDAFELSQDRPVTIKPARDRRVKRANVDIMPDADRAEFDPYAEGERLTVAVRPPPDGADGDWVHPDDLDPGNYSVNFGSKSYLAGQNAAQPQSYSRESGTLYLEYAVRAANFSLESAYGYVVGTVDDGTFVRGRDAVYPGGFDNADADAAELVITDVHVDTAGSDRGRLRDEYVEFANGGDRELDLTGWTIANGRGRTYRLPDGFTLAGGETVRLHTGDGEATASDLYWGSDESVWNDEDTVVVTDEDGETVLEYPYPQE